MGSFLNQGSHNKKTLMEGEKVIIVIGAIECNTVKDFIKIEKDATPIAIFSGTSEDYGYIDVVNPHNYLKMFVKMQERYLDDVRLSGADIFGKNLEINSESLEQYPDDENENFSHHDELSMSRVLEFIQEDQKKSIENQNFYDIVIKINEKMKEGLVVKSNIEGKTYQLIVSLFQKTMYQKALKVPLLMNDNQEVDLKTFSKNEIDRVFQETSQKFETFSQEWFEEFQKEMAHELYFTSKIFMVAESEKKFKKEMLVYYKDALELKYLKKLGLIFSPTVYAGQDYSNEIGLAYKDLITKVQKFKIK